MLRYLFLLVIYMVFQVTTYLITPLLPLFAVLRYGWINNGKDQAIEPRLPLWLSWFDTPDNSLFGDKGWRADHDGGYWSQMGWLYRNSLYGFKWGPLAYLFVPELARAIYSGNPKVNRNNGIQGLFRCQTNDGYWQWKLVKKLRGDWGVMWNFGWQLDEFVASGQRGKALFQFSPRFVTIK